jgi:hypothetical protein
MSHWASVYDFRWMKENLPLRTGPDMAAIQD